MLHLGDITKIDGFKVPITDVVCFGAPCQDLSVAGKRAGMRHESLGDEETTRSGLFMEAVRIIKEMREHDRNNGRTDEHIRPRYAIYENVPGAFSSNKAEDFRIVLEEIAKVADKDAVIPMPPNNKWTTSGCIVGSWGSIAWRVCDAQFYGVPQRRRRIALVADFGGHSAPEILFVRKSMSRDTQPSQPQRKDSPSDASRGIGADDSQCFCFEPGAAKRLGGYVWEDVSPTLRAEAGDNQVATAYTLQDREGKAGGDVCNTLVGDHNNRVTDYTALVVEPNVVALDRSAYNQGKNAQFDIGINENGTAHSLVAKGPGAVAYPEVSDGIVGTLDAHYSNFPGCRGGMERTMVYSNSKTRYIVRRLTPLECERLQGYPDGWTDIGEWTDSKGKVHKTSDAARYKALGNSIALPPWKWVMKRLCACYERDATMASLFDGIGGFPLIWEQINGKGSCLWASEIEEFPIAVTKKRIGE